ncbi:hypothetical protein PybrP1_004580 [[Pythium] brassicae (nom. inval.)]|nr:hypothetical protein PybrP1_004580 [[Pythium] brassicae (nom. inval.)]
MAASSSAPALQARVHKLLGSRAELEATQALLNTLVAGEPLAQLATGGSLAELRRSLRAALEDQQLALADAALRGLAHTLEGASQLRARVEALDARCTRVQSFLEATKRETQQVQADAARLAERKERMQRELDDVRAFLARYQLSEHETQGLYAQSLGDEHMPAFLDTMERVQQVKLDCKALAGAGDVGCALELLDAVGKSQAVGFERLYQWTSNKCAEMHDSEPSGLLHRAIALLRDRPDFYNYCKECVTASRRAVLVRRFVVALTRGGPNGIPRPIELHAHDPVRYCGDMLAWVHQAVATETEFFRVLFDGDLALELPSAATATATAMTAAAAAAGADAPEAASASMVGGAFDGVARPLEVRVEQTLTSQSGLAVAYKLVLLLAFYDRKFGALAPGSAVSRALAHCRASANRAFRQQLAGLADAVAASAQDYSTNLSATHAAMDAAHRLAALLEVFQTSLLPAGEPEGDLAPLFDALLPALALMCERSVQGLDATDALVFRVNNLSCVQAPLARFPEARAWHARIGRDLDEWLRQVSELEAKSVLDRAGVAPLLRSIQDFQWSLQASESASSSLAVQAEGLAPVTVATVMNGFCSELTTIAFPQLEQLAQPALRENARLLTATQLAAAYAFVYDFVYDLLALLLALVAVAQTRVGESAASDGDNRFVAAGGGSLMFVPDSNVAVVSAVRAHESAVNDDKAAATVAGEADVASTTTKLGDSTIVLDANTVTVTTTAGSSFKSASDSAVDAKKASLSTQAGADHDATVAGEADTPPTNNRPPPPPPSPGANTRGSDSRSHVQFAIRDGREKSRGVNLGGWLVAEHWMTKDAEIWWGLSSDDADHGEYAAMNLTRRELAVQRATAHRDHFITERDIEAIARAGLNTVRVPIGYWIVGFDRHDASDKREWRVFAPGALAYLDRLIREWAAKHNVAVLISMHAAKGSQNGADHSAPTVKGASFWGAYPENVATTLDAVQFLARRYAADAAFLGLGLLNEPAGSTTTDVLYRYYEDAYRRIREEDGNGCVLTLSPLLTEQSPAFMTALLPRATNVWVEWHRYFVWGYEAASEDELLRAAGPALRADVAAWAAASDKKLFIGEFSFAAARGQFSASTARLRAFARAQLSALADASGGYAFWTWRIDGDRDASDPYARWSLRNMLANGVVSSLSPA